MWVTLSAIVPDILFRRRQHPAPAVIQEVWAGLLFHRQNFLHDIGKGMVQGLV